MPTGMEMMLKSMGFDAEKIQRDLNEFMNAVSYVQEQLHVIKESLTRLEIKFDTLPYDVPVSVSPESLKAQYERERMLSDGNSNNGNRDDYSN